MWSDSHFRQEVQKQFYQYVTCHYITTNIIIIPFHQSWRLQNKSFILSYLQFVVSFWLLRIGLNRLLSVRESPGEASISPAPTTKIDYYLFSKIVKILLCVSTANTERFVYLILTYRRLNEIIWFKYCPTLTIVFGIYQNNRSMVVLLRYK